MPRDIRAARAWPAAVGDVQIPAATGDRAAGDCPAGVATADPEARLAAGVAALPSPARSRAKAAGVGSARASGIPTGRGCPAASTTPAAMDPDTARITPYRMATFSHRNCLVCLPATAASFPSHAGNYQVRAG